MESTMRRHFVLVSLLGLLLLAPGAAWAASSFRTSLVPDVEGTTPGFRANGSSIMIVSSGNLRVKGKLKGVVDDQGDRVDTEPNNELDDYRVEIVLYVPDADQEVTVEIRFDLRNGNGTFKRQLTGMSLPAEGGRGITVREILVIDGAGNVIGSGGVSLRR